MRAVIIYPWQVEIFIQWLEPDISKWPIDHVKQAPSNVSYEELIKIHVLPTLSHFDALRWFEDGRLIGSNNDRISRNRAQLYRLPLQRLVLLRSV